MRYLLILSGLYAINIQAQDCHQALHGVVLDASSREPLEFAQVYVREVNKGANTDEHGHYTIADLCENTEYTVEVSHIACVHGVKVYRLKENHALDFFLEHRHDTLSQITVTERAIEPQRTQTSVQLDGVQLEQNKGTSLGESMRNMSGVSLLATGASIIKPVIQGLHSNRIAIATNGVVLEGQQWGTEHAPEIDPFTANKITVVKGAAAVQYGLGALGGAVVVTPPVMPVTPGWRGWVAGGAYSNGRAGYLAASVDWKPRKGLWALRAQGTLKRSGSLHTPDYFLENTGSGEYNMSLTLERLGKKSTSELFFSSFNQDIGILRASHTGNLTDLQNAIAATIPLRNVDAFSYTINRPYQKVHHDLFKWKHKRQLTQLWAWYHQYSFQYNRRFEYDAHKGYGGVDKETRPQLSLYNYTNTLDSWWQHSPIRHIFGSVGATAQVQYNQTGTGGYVPDHLTYTASLWAVERYRRFPFPLELEAGIRADYRHSHVTDSVGTLRKIDTLLHFTTVSGTMGAIYHFGEAVNLSLNSGLAWRPPYVTELFARGVHHGAATYEQGNTTLRPEAAWNTNLSLQLTENSWQASLNLYYNTMRDFIYLQPEATTVLTIRGAFPLYTHQQADATIYGADIMARYTVWKSMYVQSQASVVRGLRDSKVSGEARLWLPLMPSDRVLLAVGWDDLQKMPAKSGWSGQLGVSTVFKQTRVQAAELLKAAPDSYTLWHLEGTRQWVWDKHPMEIGVTVRNLFNVRYREFLNFFRYYADEPGINVGLRFKFNF